MNCEQSANGTMRRVMQMGPLSYPYLSWETTLGYWKNALTRVGGQVGGNRVPPIAVRFGREDREDCCCVQQIICVEGIR